MCQCEMGTRALAHIVPRIDALLCLTGILFEAAQSPVGFLCFSVFSVTSELESV